MKILYLHQYFCPPQAPGGTRSYEFARRLVARGHQVTMVTSSAMIPSLLAAPHRRTELDIDGIRVVALPIEYRNHMTYPQRMRAFARFAAAACREAIRHEADVLFATSTPLTIALPGLFARLVHRIPMVFEVRDLWPELPIAMGALRNPAMKEAARALEWTAYHGASQVVALSPGMAEGVLSRGIEPDRVTVIPNGCDTELFGVDPHEVADYRRQRLPQLRDDQPIVFYGGTFGHINDAGWLVEVAAATKPIDPGVAFVMAGAGVEETAIVERARSRGVLGDNLHMLPPAPKREMPLVLGSATVATSLFMPLKPMWNNSANKFFDGLAAAKPMAINYGGWQAELLARSGAGIVLEHSRPDAAATELAALCRDPRRLAQMSAASSRLARTEFHRDRLAEKLERVLLRAHGRAHAHTHVAAAAERKAA